MSQGSTSNNAPLSYLLTLNMLADGHIIALFKKQMMELPYDAPNGKGRGNACMYADLNTGGKMAGVAAFNRIIDGLFLNKLENVVVTPAVVLL